MTTQYRSGRESSGTLSSFSSPSSSEPPPSSSSSARPPPASWPASPPPSPAAPPPSTPPSPPSSRRSSASTASKPSSTPSTPSSKAPNPSAVLPDLLAGDRILLVVHGQSIAGIDLAQLKPEDVRITDKDGGQSIHVTLPPSQLFLTTLDNQHTRVYCRSTGLLVPADQNLETDTRAKAEQQLQAAALADGILDTASKNARATVTTLLYSLGFHEVDVT